MASSSADDANIISLCALIGADSRLLRVPSASMREGDGLDHPIRLVFTGRQHAGENLADVLAQRQSGLPPPFHMCDGLSRNDPKGHQVVPCNCVVHARRNFVEIHGAFPDQCRKAVNYLLKRWDPLTRFLREPGAPLDNVTERLLKTSILHRKNNLPYRTVRGAHVGDLFMSLNQGVGGGAAALEFRHRPLPDNAGKSPSRPGRDGDSPADTYSDQLVSVNWRF